MLALVAAHVSAGFPVLTALVVLPLFGAVVIGLIPNSRPDMHRLVAIVTSIIAGAITLYVLYTFKVHDGRFQFVVSHTWVASLDIKFYLGVDGISLFLVVLTGILFPLALVGPSRRRREELLPVDPPPRGGLLGVFVSLDLFLFFVFFELILVPMYFLIGRLGPRAPGLRGRQVLPLHHGRLRLHAGRDHLAAVLSRTPAHWLGHHLRPASADGQRPRHQPTGPCDGCSLAFAVAFAVKVPLFPLHTWLPDAHTEAPTAGSRRLLAGVLLKIGTYGLLRFGLSLFPEAAQSSAAVVLRPGGHRHHLRRGRARPCRRTSSGWSPTRRWPTWASSCWACSRSTQQASTAAVLQMVNHGLSTGALFLLVGMIYERRTPADLRSSAAWPAWRPGSPASSPWSMLRLDRRCPGSTASSASSWSSRHLRRRAAGGRWWPPAA